MTAISSFLLLSFFVIEEIEKPRNMKAASMVNEAYIVEQ